MTTISESTVEQAAPNCMAAQGWQTAHGPDIAPVRQAQSGPTTGRWSAHVGCGIP